MTTKILKREGGGYYVATENDNPLTPTMSLEEAKCRKKVIDAYREQTNLLNKPQEPNPIQKEDTRLSQEAPAAELPCYAKNCGGKWMTDRVGKFFITFQNDQPHQSTPKDEMDKRD